MNITQLIAKRKPSWDKSNWTQLSFSLLVFEHKLGKIIFFDRITPTNFINDFFRGGRIDPFSHFLSLLLSSPAPISARTLTQANGARADNNFRFHPPAPLHHKLFKIVKTILYWTYHTETWQGAIYYDPNKYYELTSLLVTHSLTHWLTDWLTFLVSFSCQNWA